MNITDTHTHLYMDIFEKDLDVIIKNSLSQGIVKFFLPSINKISVKKIIKLKNKYPNIIYPMIGLHPNYVHPSNIEKELDFIQKFINKYSFISIGEIGMDFHLSNKFEYEQKYVFKTQIKLAQKKELPIVIHCRKAFNQVFDILSKEPFYNSIKGVFHCFTGNLEEAIKITNIGMKLGIGGIITFKNNSIVNFLHKIKLDNILLETDSPYLSPHPFRGERNTPINIKIVLKKLSQIYMMPENEIANIIEKNVKNLFFQKD
ncbi:TatD family hydrolase [Blattabacterium cuenoti]|uniref:TatD family hydrolase n=1 Tax=Blattabacterium cuenoti TaxID=1653831 RepID=UPI00163C0F59|nr:TatD family hydrolase [Blattabacterium cuenoti]